ncbi:MAG: Omp28-related outer membrane protein [Bacteroidales bacterium]|jgi:hypothetical protein|nr:Omp28-related outer membrane protein [Bacteroidales bacterium]
MKKIPLLLTTLSILLFSCNKIDTSKEVFQIIGQVEVTPWDTAYVQTVIQKIYIEEFTGHRCTYCPEGARELKAIMEEDSTIIVTAIHCTSLANAGSAPFDKDYKTPMGERLCDDFKIGGLPKATINRKKIFSDNELGLDRARWRNAIKSIDRNNVRAGIQLKCNVDTVQKEVEAEVIVTIIKELPNPVQLCLVLQQDNIISGQIDNGVTIPDYIHNHMLRTGFNGNYGTPLTPNGMVNAQSKYTTTFKIAYQNSFPNSYIPVKIDHCSVVAYLIDMVTKEVVQAEIRSMRSYYSLFQE